VWSLLKERDFRGGQKKETKILTKKSPILRGQESILRGQLREESGV
jgi:hypothetical protein